MSGRWILLAAVLAAGSARAEAAEDLQSVEFTPFYGVAFSGGLEDEDLDTEFEIDDSDCYGGFVDFRLADNTQLELFFSRQETELETDNGLFAGETLFDIDVSYFHIGGTYILTDTEWQPFVVGTLGATYLDPDAAGTDSLTRFSIAVGGGVRYFPLANLGLYLAGRGFFTFMEGDTLFRSEDGAATVVVDSDGLWQVQLQAGAIFAF